MIPDSQNDIKNLQVLQNNPDSKEVSFQRNLKTGDSSDVNLQDIREVFVFTQHQKHLEFKAEENSDVFELDHDVNGYTGRTDLGNKLYFQSEFRYFFTCESVVLK